MVQTNFGNSVFERLRPFLLKLFQGQFLKKNKTHDYTKRFPGVDYVFELAADGDQAYMTSQGKGVKRGDYIILPSELGFSRYQICDIDYYSNPLDMWMAVLKLATD